jgi:hypothetical protein
VLGRNRGMAAAVVALGTLASCAWASHAWAQGPAIEPEATRLLKRMTDYLGGLERFSLDTDNMLEDVLVSGQKLQYGFSSSVSVRRPDRLRAARTGDVRQQLLLYDGASLTIHDPKENYFARAAAPDDIDGMLHFARDTLDIVPPSGDLIYTNAFDLLMANVTEGAVVGKAMVGGVRCDHLAFRTPTVDWQIWIADGDKPLPYRYVLTTMDDPAFPQYLVLMSNWNVDPKLDDALFRFAKPEGAKEIEFLRTDARRSSKPRSATKEHEE